LDEVDDGSEPEADEKTHHADGVLPACVLGDAVEGERDEEHGPSNGEGQDQAQGLVHVREQEVSQEQVQSKKKKKKKEFKEASLFIYYTDHRY